MRQLDLQGPAGRLEALLEGAPGARFAAMVCHPHPRLGGTLHNHATYRLARAARTAGGLVLRFNYRGVGRSAGRYDRGRGEAEDARAALASLKDAFPGLPILACGFSFGAWMAISAGGTDPEVRGFLLAGVALRSVDLVLGSVAPEIAAPPVPPALAGASGPETPSPQPEPIAELTQSGPRELRAVERPIAVIQGERDELGPPPEVERALAGSRGPRRMAVVPRATHLFTEDLAGLQREAEAALAWLILAGEIS